jgi:iron complex outermembrane receptor protein
MADVRRSRRLALLATAALAFGVSGVAQAAESAAPAAVEELIVTAQKRAQNLQDVPISMSAISGETLMKSGVSNLDGLQHFAPGLTISAVGSGFVSYTYLRGGGTNQIDAGSDPSVAYFIDEVYVGGTAGLQFDLLDIDRVEVLKGPQGTLFGRNAAAGAISVTTRRPSQSFVADLNAEAGDYDDYKLRGAVTGPLRGDGLLYRLSAGYARRSSYTENLAGGGDPNHAESYGVRGQLEWVGANARFLLSAEALQSRNGMTNQFPATADKSGLISAAGIAALPSGESFYKRYYNTVGYERQNLADITGRLEWTTPIGELTSITALRSNTFKRLQDQDGTLAPSFILQSREKDRTFSQEIRLAGHTGARLHWIAGVYYYNASTDDGFIVPTGPAFPVPAAQNIVRTDISRISTRSYAAFGQATFDVTQDLSLILGGRYTEDHKHDERAVKGLGPLFTVSPSAKWNAFDPAATLQYRFGPDAMAYASYRRGFKSGGFQTLLPATAAIANTPFLPERVSSYEIGLKTQWFERRLVADAAIFRTDITDQQILRITGPAQQTIDNAGETRTDGVDISLNARPVEPLRLGADMTFQNARFRRYQNGAVSFAGHAQLRSPDFMGAYTAEYDIAVGTSGLMTLRGEYTYRSKTFFDAANTQLPGVYQPGYGLLNARITYAPAGGDWRVSLWGKNLTDKQYFRNLTPSGATALGVPGDPLTFGVAVDATFR